MENTAKESRSGKIPGLALSLIFFGVSIIFAFALEYITIPDYIELIFFIGLIPIACFFICMKHPKSVKYTPFICNPVALLGTVFHPLVWTTWSDYLPWVISLVLSVLAAIIGSIIGRRN